MQETATTVKKKWNIKNFFIKENENTEQPKEQDSKNTSTINIPTYEAIGNGSFDQRIFDVLQKSIKESNLDGQDYFEFKAAIDTMNSLPLSEQIKFQSAFATFSSMGVNTKTLIESANYYIGVLQKEKKDFSDTISLQTKENITNKESDIKRLETNVVEKTEQIKKIQEEIAKSQNEINSIKNQISESTSKIKIVENNYNFTFNMVESKIKEDIDKIQNYIK